MRRSYNLTKWQLVWRMARTPGEPVVVFAMGKTGSTALKRALIGAVDEPVFKIHLLLPSSVRRAELEYRRTDPNARPRHVLDASYLLRHMPTPDAPWRVITIVREPFARAASDFFQSGARAGRLVERNALTERFRDFAARESVPRTLSWFDDEMLPSLGIDVYSHRFEPAVGHTVIEWPAVRMLVLRQEDLASAGAVVGEFLGLPSPLPLITRNAGSSKPYADLYALVRREARFDDATLQSTYESRYARHFYSADERAAFAQRWRSGEGWDVTFGDR